MAGKEEVECLDDRIRQSGIVTVCALLTEARLLGRRLSSCRSMPWARNEAGGDVVQSGLRHDSPLCRLSSEDGFDLGPAEGREAVHDGYADLDLGGLAVGVS